MLFNSYLFLFIFLPGTLLIFHWLSLHTRHEISWLATASLVFYGWWNPAYLFLIIGSVTTNFFISSALVKTVSEPQKKLLLTLGILFNLGLIGYFKYANFFIDNINSVTGNNFFLGEILLPLGISFFTFQQIAYLIDVSKGQIEEYKFIHYAAFVTFFPQLIAGPIVHHNEMMPQFAKREKKGLSAENLCIGSVIFTIGLFKKVIIADGVAEYSTPVFDAADSGLSLTLIEAWGGALAYTFQLYFDFSGYSDMAIGLARMFGIILPVNFSSPYKACSIISFWRSWHITLSRFLRDYLYIPLGGKRKGSFSRYKNLLITMLLGGLWHGAAWNFVLWGGLHGIYLIINHLWRRLFPIRDNPSAARNIFGCLITFTAVLIAWVPFRAETLIGTKSMFSAMFFLNGGALPASYQKLLNNFAGFGDWLANHSWKFERIEFYFGTPQIVFFLILFIVIWGMPNTQEIMRKYKPVIQVYEPKQGFSIIGNKLFWQPTVIWLLISIIMLLIGILGLTRVSEFLYFQF